VQKFSKYL